MQITVCSDEEMQQLGRSIAGVLTKGDVIYLNGVLGAGKTTLVRGIARGLGYSGRVSSPTFTLMNIYPGTTPIYHFDLYRLESGDLDDLGWEEYLEKDGISMVEWPGAGAVCFPEEAILVDIRLCDDDYDLARQVEIRAGGDKYRQKLEELKKCVITGCR